MYPRAQAVVVQTGEVARWAEEIGCPADRVRVVPNPVEVPADTGKRPPVPQGGRRAIAVGRMDRWKGFDLLLRAFAKCRATAPERHLTVLGDGPERQALERLSAELAVADRVSFPGRVANPGDWMRASDLFVMSSLYEGFPNALLEAMACGMAVVSFDCPSGPREIIRTGIDGVLVPPRDCDALAAAMAGLMRDDAARRDLGAEALKVVDRFSLDRVVAMWDSVIAGTSAQRK
jgi:glycosyltransferase involved in cell wall biosynthesis